MPAHSKPPHSNRWVEDYLLENGLESSFFDDHSEEIFAFLWEEGLEVEWGGPKDSWLFRFDLDGKPRTIVGYCQVWKEREELTKWPKEFVENLLALLG